nr:hypothetical protein [Tanacetum cinerariifolium]
MLTREEWEEFREVRPRTPFESKLARPNARIRTGEPLHLYDFLKKEATKVTEWACWRQFHKHRSTTTRKLYFRDRMDSDLIGFVYCSQFHQLVPFGILSLSSLINNEYPACIIACLLVLAI